MGYWKNLEIALATEEADRYPTRRDRRRRETYAKLKRQWVLNALDMTIVFVGIFCALALGLVIGYAIGVGHFA